MDTLGRLIVGNHSNQSNSSSLHCTHGASVLQAYHKHIQMSKWTFNYSHPSDAYKITLTNLNDYGEEGILGILGIL